MHAQGHVARRYAISLQEMASEKCSHWRTPARGGVGGQCVKGACNSRTGERESRVDPDFVLQSQRSKSGCSGFGGCGSQALEHRFNSCGTRA